MSLMSIHAFVVMLLPKRNIFEVFPLGFGDNFRLCRFHFAELTDRSGNEIYPLNALCGGINSIRLNAVSIADRAD
jgi:hypothetical protein